MCFNKTGLHNNKPYLIVDPNPIYLTMHSDVIAHLIMLLRWSVYLNDEIRLPYCT